MRKNGVDDENLTTKRKRRWTEDETRLALYLYFQLPFGQLHQKNPEIQKLAIMIDRSPSSVAMKLANFASLDPKITATGRRGLSGASEQDRMIWAEFESDWSGQIANIESKIEKLSKSAKNKVKEKIEPFLFPDINSPSERQILSQRRIGQEFFRRAVLANFEYCCCITGIAEPSLLIASHIIPWAENERLRHNPANGLALSPTFDRAFDIGLIGVDEDRRLLVSENLKNHPNKATREFFTPFSGKRISDPIRFHDSNDFLEWHRRERFKGESAL
ncbi:putative restriction endonuclease [Erythrobacter sp. HL-111]|nr:MAG: putative restriction endonuclease [Erythrobacteraceae bacterium HL-111]SDS06875.1 putative restriction endonuclease [Erythrobacter sp. HL-111]